MILAALTLAAKDVRLLLRDPMALFWALGFPVLFALLMGNVLMGGLSRPLGPLSVAAVDEDGSRASRGFFTALEATRAVVLHPTDAEAALRQVRHGERVALVRLPSGFAERVARQDWPVVELGVDPSRSAEAAYLHGHVLQALVAMARPESPGGHEPVRWVEALAPGAARSGFELALPMAVVWALIGCSATFAVSMVAERTAGTLLRLQAAAIGVRTIVAGKALACLAACLVSGGLLWGIASLLFGLRGVNVPALGLAMGSVALCFVGLSMALGAAGRTEQAVTGAGWGTLVLMAMLGGGMIPLLAMPPWMRRLSELSPVKWAITSLEGATFRGLPAAELLPRCGVLAAVGLAGVLLGAELLRRADT